MKHIIIEGGDRLGKSTLIEGLVHHFNYDNVTIRHFGKPPKVFPEGVSPLAFQANCFEYEGDLLNIIKQQEDGIYCYYENVIIWNRGHIGEYVYGQMFRGQDPIKIEKYLKNYEEKYLIENQETYLILLTADPEFFLSKEDGKSFSQNFEQKKKELQLFDNIYEKSIIDKKLKIKVNIDDTTYISKPYILNSVLDFMKYKNELL